MSNPNGLSVHCVSAWGKPQIAKQRGRGRSRNVSVTLATTAACKRIAYQFPQTPEGRLMFAIVAAAIHDLMTTAEGDDVEHDRARAARYLRGEIWHAQIAGVDPDWIRRTLRMAGLDFEGV